jgi:hypothetical protein
VFAFAARASRAAKTATVRTSSLGQRARASVNTLRASVGLIFQPLVSQLGVRLSSNSVVAAKTYIVTFRRHKDRRPSKFIVVADSMREAIDMAWEHVGADFQAMFDRTTGQALEMKKGVLRVL